MVPFDDNSLGFTATDLLAELGRPNTGQITWYDGTSTALHMQVRYVDPKVRIDTSRDLTARGRLPVDVRLRSGRLAVDR